MLDHDRLLEQSRDVLCRELEGELILYDRRSGGVMLLDRIGGIVWRAIETPRLIEDVVGEVASACGVDPAEVRADVCALVEELCGALLVQNC